MEKPTKEDIEKALAVYDDRNEKGLCWLNMAKAIETLAAAYREKLEALNETTKAMWREHAAAQALQMYLDAETEERRKWAVRAEMAERHLAEIIEYWREETEGAFLRIAYRQILRRQEAERKALG